MATDDTKYDEIDVEGLANALAEETWEEMTKKNPDEELYEMIADYQGNLSKQIRPYWATEFFQLNKIYKLIINQFRRNPLPENKIE